MVKSKKLFEPLIYFIRHDSQILRVGGEELPNAILEMLIKKNGIVIWENQGTFALISAPILHNVWLTYGTSHKIKKEYPLAGCPHNLKEIAWKQGIILTSTIVNNLLLIPNEKRNGFPDPKPATNTTGKNQADQP